jgi:hypothetical protein
MKFVHDECCDMLLTLGICNCWAAFAAREYALRYHSGGHPNANVFRWLEHRLLEIRSLISTALVTAGRPTDSMDTSQLCHNYSCGKTAVKKSTRYHTTIEAIPPRITELLHNDQLHPYHYSPSTRMSSSDAILRMVRHQCTEDDFLLHSILWTNGACFACERLWGCIQRP